jgi:hypothetical protein
VNDETFCKESTSGRGRANIKMGGREAIVMFKENLCDQNEVRVRPRGRWRPVYIYMYVRYIYIYLIYICIYINMYVGLGKKGFRPKCDGWM